MERQIAAEPFSRFNSFTLSQILQCRFNSAASPANIFIYRPLHTLSNGGFSPRTMRVAAQPGASVRS